MSAESGCGIVSDLNSELYIYFSDNSKGLIKGVFESDILARLFKMYKGFTS